MLHDYMVCYHVVLTEMVPSELFPVACRLDRERPGPTEKARLLCRRLRAPLKTPTTEEPGFLGLSPALFVSKLFVDVMFNVV